MRGSLDGNINRLVGMIIPFAEICSRGILVLHAAVGLCLRLIWPYGLPAIILRDFKHASGSAAIAIASQKLYIVD
jgi:hypothetical protein